MNEQKTILVVEDDEVDVMTIKRAMKEIHVTNPVKVKWNGEEALEYLQGEKDLPGIILLDLNMPRMDGREVLEALKGDRGLRSIPVVILTTSDAEQDIMASYDLGANCYLKKPLGLDDFLHVVKSVENFWLTLVKLPPRDV